MAQLVKAAELAAISPTDGVSRRVVVGNKLMLALIEIQPGQPVQTHSHPHEQMGYVISGRVLFRAGTLAKELGPGDMYAMAGGEEHGVEVLGQEPALLLDVFTPIREDFLLSGR
ncbi:MAG: cupin domain-containing protein [Anaerolineae bacterium]